MNEKRKQFVSLALALTMTAGLLGSMSGCDKTEPGGSPSVVDTEKFPVMGSAEETQGVSEIFPGLDFSEKKGSPVLSDIIWLEGRPDYDDYFEGVKLFIEELIDGTRRLRDYSGNVLGEYDDIDLYQGFSEGFCCVEKDGKWGYIDTTGQVAIPLKYNAVQAFSDGLAWVEYKNGKWGRIDTTGEFVVPPTFDDGDYITIGGAYSQCFIDTKDKIVIPRNHDDEFDFNEDGLAIVLGNGGYGCCDTNGSLVIPTEYRDMDYCSDGLFLVRKDDKFGYIDTAGRVVVPLEYDYLAQFSEGLATAKKDGKWGYIDRKGQVVIPLEYTHAEGFSDGFAWVANDGRLGFIDSTGQFVAAPKQYDVHTDFSEGMAFCRFGMFVEYIDSKGQVIFEGCEIGRDFHAGHAVVKKDGTWSVIDTTGTIVRSLEYNDIDNFSEGLAKVERDGKWGYIDYEGRIVIPLEYDWAFNFSEDGFVEVMKDSQVYKIDTKGQILDSMDLYDWLESSDYSDYLILAGFHEGLAKIEQDGKYGYGGTNGEVVIPVEYDDAEDFSGGFARVRKDGKYGLIDTKGEIVVPLEYDCVGRFSEGLVMVEKDEEWGYLDTKGQIVIAPEYDLVNGFSEGLAAVCKYGDWGYIDTTGQVVIPLEYDRADLFTEGFGIVEKDDKYGMVDTNGTLLLPLEYEDDDDIKIAKNGELIFVRKGESWGFCTVTWH